MKATTATAEIRKTAAGYEAVTRVGNHEATYSLPADPADARAYAAGFRERAESAGLEVQVRIDT